jgi:hypothetical protein
MFYRYAALLFTMMLLVPGPAKARDADQPSAGQADGPIPPGTTITMQNWENFKQYMPDGMAAMFEGKYSWKMPDDVAMEVVPA